MSTRETRIKSFRSDCVRINNNGYNCACCLDPRLDEEKKYFYRSTDNGILVCSSGCWLLTDLSQTQRPQGTPEKAGDSNWSFEIELLAIANVPPDYDIISLVTALTSVFAEKHLTISCVNETNCDFVSDVSEYLQQYFQNQTMKVSSTGFSDNPNALVCFIGGNHKISTLIEVVRRSWLNQPNPCEVKQKKYNDDPIIPHVPIFGFMRLINGGVEFIDLPKRMTTEEIAEGKWILASEFIRILIELNMTITLTVKNLSMKKLGRHGLEFFSLRL